MNEEMPYTLDPGSWDAETAKSGGGSRGVRTSIGHGRKARRKSPKALQPSLCQSLKSGMCWAWLSPSSLGVGKLRLSCLTISDFHDGNSRTMVGFKVSG